MSPRPGLAAHRTHIPDDRGPDDEGARPPARTGPFGDLKSDHLTVTDFDVLEFA
jgi:hypothetical protein